METVNNQAATIDELIEKAAQAHTNLNIFAAVVSMLEGGCIYTVGMAPETAQKIIQLCKKEQQHQLWIYDMAAGGKR